MRSASRANSSSELVGLFVGRAAGAAGFAGAVDLHHALARGERAGRRHFLDQRLDVGAEELVRAIAGLADQVEVPRVPVGMLEAEPAFAEIHLAGDARLLHPLQGAVDGGAADAMVFALDQVDQIVGAQVSLLLEEHVDDQVALAGALGAGRPEAIEIWNGRAGGHDLTCPSYAEKDEPQPQVDVAFGFLMVNPPPVMVSTKSTSAPFR